MVKTFKKNDKMDKGMPDKMMDKMHKGKNMPPPKKGKK
ncbi:MAG: hypothetical protein UU10_C0041G0003 [Parcubacteria group bacterium GW2011_GWF1_40_6]|nr:MAG: hypothetical protein UU10_C0041G0003 [Parcubacteria group bacterium GW2011_GWF1_40_6]